MAKLVDGKWVFSDQEILTKVRGARRKADDVDSIKHVASSLEFNRVSGQLIIKFKDGFLLGFPVEWIEELREATPGQIKRGRLSDLGDAIYWDELNAHYSIAGFLAGRFGTKSWMRALAKRGGSIKSRAKTEAARRNGIKGGRPKKTQPATSSGRRSAATFTKPSTR